jgi:hypothetical protein
MWFDIQTSTKKKVFPNYRMFIYKEEYDPKLPIYYNNNHHFLDSHLNRQIIKKEKFFEKCEIRWIASDELKGLRPSFRCYFQEMIDKIIENERKIYDFISSLPPTSSSKSKTKTRRMTRKKR